MSKLINFIKNIFKGSTTGTTSTSSTTTYPNVPIPHFSKEEGEYEFETGLAIMVGAGADYLMLSTDDGPFYNVGGCINITLGYGKVVFRAFSVKVLNGNMYSSPTITKTYNCPKVVIRSTTSTTLPPTTTPKPQVVTETTTVRP